MQRPPSWILVFQFVIPLSGSSRLPSLTSSSTLLHLLCDVYQINKSHLELLPLASVSSRSGLLAAPPVMTNLTRPTTPQPIPREPVTIP